MICPLCRRESGRPRYRLPGKQIFWCRTCRSFFVDPFPASIRLHDLYEEGAEAFQEKYFESFQDLRSRSFARGLKTLAALHRRGRLLDVGTGLGFFLEAARKAGWEVEGLELSEKVAQYARKHLQVPVHVGILAEVPLKERTYQAVTMWDVLEHLPDPAGALRRIRTLLAPKGVVLIRTPVCDSLIPWMIRLFYRFSFGKFRFGFEKLFKEHLFHFSEEGLRTLVRAAGFRILLAYREDYINSHALREKSWARNPVIRLGAHLAIGLGHLIRRQDEVVLYAEVETP